MANKKVIRLTEKDLELMVRKMIKESDETNTPIKPITIHGKTYNFVEDLPTRELGIGSYIIQDGIVMVDGETPLQDWLTQDMDVESDEDYMSSEEDLINATYDLMYDLGDEDVEILDLRDAANILDEELYEGNHGPVMEEKIEDLLTRIEAVIGYPDDEEGENIEDHLDYMSGDEDLINATYELLYDLGYDHVEDDYIQNLDEAIQVLEEELYNADNYHGPILNKKIEDLLSQIYEVKGYPDQDDDSDYMAFKKPGIMQRLKQGVRDIVGKGNEDDENTLAMIYRVMKQHPNLIESVRQDTRNNAITAWVNGKALIVDRNTPEIIYNGKNLEIADLEHKTFMLYNELISFLD